MRKLIAIVLLFGLPGGLCYLLSHYEVKQIDGHIIISRQGQQANLQAGAAVQPTAAEMPTPTAENAGYDALPPKAADKTRLRIGSFHLDGLNSRKLAMPLLKERLAVLLGSFDVVALQDIRQSHVGALHELLDVVNAGGRHFDFAVSPEVELGSVRQFNAFFFDRATIEIDRLKLCTVNDTSRQMRCRPLVGMFRARPPQASDAFTFILININVDLQRADVGLGVLDDVFRAVQAANPKEDDVIMLGSFETDPGRPGPLAMIPGLGWAIEGLVSTVRGDRLADNLVFDRQATAEFTGRADVVDVVRSLNVTSAEAANISGHLPVWAEFSVFESITP